MLKKTLVAAAAFSLVASPVIAQAQVTAPAPAPAVEEVDGSEMRGRGRILPFIAVAAIILAILALTDTWPFGDSDSP